MRRRNQYIYNRRGWWCSFIHLSIHPLSCHFIHVSVHPFSSLQHSAVVGGRKRKKKAMIVIISCHDNQFKLCGKKLIRPTSRSFLGGVHPDRQWGQHHSFLRTNEALDVVFVDEKRHAQAPFVLPNPCEYFGFHVDFLNFNINAWTLEYELHIDLKTKLTNGWYDFYHLMVWL